MIHSRLQKWLTLEKNQSTEHTKLDIEAEKTNPSYILTDATKHLTKSNTFSQ